MTSEEFKKSILELQKLVDESGGGEGNIFLNFPWIPKGWKAGIIVKFVEE